MKTRVMTDKTIKSKPKPKWEVLVKRALNASIQQESGSNLAMIVIAPGKP